MTSLRLFAVLLFAAPLPATAQVTIDSHGLRAGGTVIDATGVHTRGATVDAAGVHTRAAARTITANHLVRQIDCGGGTLTVNGNSNQLTVTGCRTVTIAGNENVIQARFDAPSTLTVAGNRDSVTYAAAPHIAVSVSNVGTRSSVTRR